MLLGSIIKLFPLPFRGTRKYLLYRTLFLLKRNRGTFRTGRQENIQSHVKTEFCEVIHECYAEWSQCSFYYNTA